MKDLIVIRYGELSTKKDNINFFLSKLRNNIEEALEGLEYRLFFDHGRMYIETNDKDSIINKLQYIFGIYDINLVDRIDKDLNNIKDEALKLINTLDIKTFKVETKRVDKTYPLTSMEISKEVGAYILKNTSLKVDVNNPDYILEIELRNDYTYIYKETYKGLGGYPISSNGKGLLMLSGGIDSPVAGYLAMKRGIKIECVYFAAPPHTSKEALNKVLSLVKVLTNYQKEIKVHIINFTEIEEAIYKDIPRDYLITIMRRMMYRISSKLCYNNHAKAIINGESIGQVASQTLTSLNVIGSVTDIPVIRPVACFDKIDIIKLAQEIKTYDISILPYEDCCTIFVPEHPVINPDINKAIDYEKLINYEEMISTCLKKEDKVKITNKEDNYSSLL